MFSISFCEHLHLHYFLMITFTSFLILLIPHTHSAAASAGDSAGLGMYDRDEVDRGDDEGENWVDVDPQELLALGYSHSTGSAAAPDAGKIV